MGQSWLQHGIKGFDKIFVLKKIEICDPLLPPLESAIAGKCEVPQPHVLIFFLISSSFSASSAIANSNQKFLEAIQKTYQIWHSWFMIILWVFFWIIFFFIFSFFYFSWAKIILGIFFLNKIFFVFVFIYLFFFFLIGSDWPPYTCFYYVRNKHLEVLTNWTVDCVRILQKER